jgi:acyl-CoA thioesterase YciA
LAAGNAAARRARGRCVTVAVDGMTFHSAVHVGDEVTVYADLISIGRTSMKFQVEAWRRSRDGDERIKVTEAIFTFVAIDSGSRPRPLPSD